MALTYRHSRVDYSERRGMCGYAGCRERIRDTPAHVRGVAVKLALWRLEEHDEASEVLPPGPKDLEVLGELTPVQRLPGVSALVVRHAKDPPHRGRVGRGRSLRPRGPAGWAACAAPSARDAAIPNATGSGVSETISRFGCRSAASSRASASEGFSAYDRNGPNPVTRTRLPASEPEAGPAPLESDVLTEPRFSCRRTNAFHRHLRSSALAICLEWIIQSPRTVSRTASARA